MGVQENLTGYISSLREVDHQDNEAFQSLLSRGFELLNLFDKDVAREFSVSRPTVTRWRNGENAPHPAMRKFVYLWLEQRAAGLLKREERVVVASGGSGGSARPLPMAASGRR